MNYELAKQLKDAGFEKDGFYINEQNIVCREPSLSELIKACGEEFISLEYIKNGGLDGKEKIWWASSNNHFRAGETPEEAVARLWLALNKK